MSYASQATRQPCHGCSGRYRCTKLKRVRETHPRSRCNNFAPLCFTHYQCFYHYYLWFFVVVYIYNWLLCILFVFCRYLEKNCRQDVSILPCELRQNISTFVGKTTEDPLKNSLMFAKGAKCVCSAKKYRKTNYTCKSCNKYICVEYIVPFFQCVKIMIPND